MHGGKHVRRISLGLGVALLVWLLAGCGRIVQMSDDGLPQPVQTWGGFLDPITNFDLSPDGKLLVLERENTLDLIDTTDWHQTRSLYIHEPWGIGFSRDGKTIMAHTAHDVVRWDTRTWTSRRTGGVTSSSLVLPDGRTLVYDDKKATVTTAHGPMSIPTYPDWKDDQAMVSSPDGKLLAVGGINEVMVLDTKTWRSVRTFTGDWIGDPVRKLMFSPNGKLLAAGGNSTVLKVWRVGSWHDAYTLLAHEGVGSVDFSPDSHLLATTGTDLHLWNADTGALQGSLSIVRAPEIGEAEFTRDGKSLVTTREDQSVNVWTVSSILSAKKSR